MKSIFTFFLLAGFASTGFSQSHSCCTASATGPSDPTVQFASFSTQETFKMSHDEPQPFEGEKPAAGSVITYPTPDGKTASAYFIKSEKPSATTLFVIHEWWGLNDYIKQEAERFSSELKNVNVMALDLYDGKVATTRDSAGAYMGAVKTERAQSIIKGAIAFSGEKSTILTIGWCFGGGWSLQSSLLAGKQAGGCVLYYGQPESDPEKLKSLNADVLGIYATKDQWINKEMIASFEAAMKKAGKNATSFWYEADHAFANPSNPKHNKEFAEDAHKKALDFLAKRVK
ncbi:MAG: dienelactone hydrolase family protein [Bacteroidetes bacterium]|nr:dienelactone hydrolase family protein [Bacteroidota bacterium]